MNNLCYGMKVINITQLPGGSFSHPNGAMDMAGSDAGIDFWFAQGRWKCIAGPWGNGTYFFTAVDAKGNVEKVHCADGKDRVVTLALTHSAKKYVKTKLGAIYENGIPLYEEGTVGKATGNHIHYEVAEGIRTTKYYNSKLRVYQMTGELNPIKVTFVNKAFSRVASSSLGKASLKYCDKLTYKADPVKTYKVTAKSGLRLRKDAGTTSDILVLMPLNTVVTYLNNKKTVNNTPWFNVKATVNGKTYQGWCSSEWLG